MSKNRKTRGLTPQQKKFYEENGYIIIKENVDDTLLDEMKQHFIDLCNGKANARAVLMIMKDPSLKKTGAKGEYLINKMQDFIFDNIFWKYVSNDNVVNVVQDIIGPNITAVHTMFINKPPNADSGSSLHPMHQDMHYFPFKPADKIVASWTAIERVDENNGCLYVVPGSHKGPLYQHTYPDGFKKSLYHGVKGFEHMKRVLVIMDKGDTVFFHPHLLHGSGPNKTKGFRKAISCHYANSDCVFVDVTGTTQERLGRESETLAKKLFGIDMKFQDLWKLKSRLVRGEPGNFQKMDSHL